MRRRKGFSENSGDNVLEGESGLASSFTDLMTSLAVIFILLLVATLNNTQQEGESTRNAILLKLQQKLESELKDYKEQGFVVKTDPKDPLALIIIVPEGLLNFELNKSDIPLAGTKFLKLIIPKISSVMCDREFRDQIDSVIVEGHTDSSGTDELNLGLSQSRSLAVVNESLRILKLPESGASANESRSCFLLLLSATGRGSADPIMDENGVENRDRSRRVVFKVRVRSLEQRMIQRFIPNQDSKGIGR